MKEGWFEELQGRAKTYVPGGIECSLQLYVSLKSPSVQESVRGDIRRALIDWIPEYEAMALKLKGDPIAAPTYSEKSFYRWAKGVVSIPDK